MSCLLLRSTKSKLLSSSISRSTNHIGSLSPLAAQLFHRNTATLPNPDENSINRHFIDSPKFLENKLLSHSNDINSLRYQALGLNTNAFAGSRYGTNVCAAKSPMLSGLSVLMSRNFQRGVDADTFGLAGQKRFMSDISSKSSETKPSAFRPLSPHLPVYQPQLSSTLSIFNRMAGAFLAAVTLLFYMIYMKMGLSQLIPEQMFDPEVELVCFNHGGTFFPFH